MSIQEKLQKIRDNLYSVNSVNVSLHMIAMKIRDDNIVNHTNECLGEILKQLDEIIIEIEKSNEHL